MHTSQFWLRHFTENLQIKRIDWRLNHSLNDHERSNILTSLQAWQLGETSDGNNLLRASRKYAEKINDPIYVSAVEFFIKEEQKHGNNLGIYLDLIGEKRITYNWGDTLFRKFRYFNSSMELWTLSVITVESTAQIFYQSLKDATNCKLLQQICTDILIDEAFHIQFQLERMLAIYHAKGRFSKLISYYLYKMFYFTTIMVVWFAHKRLFQAGNNGFLKYMMKMNIKFNKTLGKVKAVTSQHVIMNDVELIYG